MEEASCMYPKLSDQTQFGLNKINKMKDYFITKIREKEAVSQRLSKYIAVFNCFENILIVLSATSGGVSIATFASVFGAPVGVASASFNSAFSLSTIIIKKLLKTTKNKSKIHNKY